MSPYENKVDIDNERTTQIENGDWLRNQKNNR